MVFYCACSCSGGSGTKISNNKQLRKPEVIVNLFEVKSCSNVPASLITTEMSNEISAFCRLVTIIGGLYRTACLVQHFGVQQHQLRIVNMFQSMHSVTNGLTGKCIGHS